MKIVRTCSYSSTDRATEVMKAHKEFMNKTIKCLNCGREFHPRYSSLKIFCSIKCQQEYKYKEYIRKWKNGEESGTKADITYSNHIRRYLLEKYNNKCQLCGWGRVNEYTGRVPLQVHHIDGDCTNNKEENLQLLCPNCHSLTDNFGRRNKNAAKGRSKYFGRA